MKNPRHLALLSALLPVAFASGCGGGGSGNSPVVPTRTLAPSPTLVPLSTTVPENNLRGTTLRLPNKQVGILTLTSIGNAVAGELQVINRGDGTALLPLGVFPVSGSFAEPNAFDVKGNAGSAGDFTITGTLPIERKFTPGNFNLTVGGISNVGTLPTQTDAVAPAPMPFLAVGDIQFSDFSTLGPVTLADYPFDLLAVAPNGAGTFNATPPPAFGQSSFVYTIQNDGVSSSLNLIGVRKNPVNPRQDLQIVISLRSLQGAKQPPFLAGQTYNLDRLTNNTSLDVGVILNGVPLSSFTTKNFNYTGEVGSLTIKSIGPDSITCELKNVRLNNYNQFPIADTTVFPNDGTRKPISSFVLNGTIDFSGVQGQVIDNVSQ